MNIDEICYHLEKGNLVITPTDTVYGIMGDATNEEVIKKIYETKKRSYNKPLILLMNNYDMIKQYTKNISNEEETLIKEFMPGLVTIILQKNNKINNLITANTEYVGIRIPKQNDLLKIIENLGRPVISTSANISETNVITSIDMIDNKLLNNIDYIYDGGIQPNNSSTIVKFEGTKLKIIREGELTPILKERFK